MRARVLVAVTGVIAAIGVVPIVGSVPASCAEATPEAALPKQPAAGEPEAQATPAPPRGRSDRTREKWWAHAREVLLGDLVLSEDQARQIDALVERQIGARNRAVAIQAELRDARRDRDTERGAALQAKLSASRAELRDPAVLIEEMRALLSEDQRPSFDMNRARLVAELQQARATQPRRRPNRAAPGADAPAPSE
jgi:hypothetical protein